MSALEFLQGPGWFAWLLNLSAQAALLCVVVYAVTKAVGRWIPPSWRALLWFLVIARLLIPIAPPSRFSLQNLFVTSKPAPVVAAPLPKFQFNIQDLGTPPPVAPELTSAEVEAFPDVAAAPAKPFPIQFALAVVWSVGAGLSLAVLGARSFLLRRRLRASGIQATPAMLEVLGACKKTIGLKYPVRVTASHDVAAPALTGLFPARLIVPETFAAPHYSGEQVRQILLHELAHIKQGHLLLHWLALLARSIHWFNPFVHFAASHLRQECELAADAAALGNATESERAAYGETILQVLAQTVAPSSALALGMAEQARHLEQRLRALTQNNARSYRILGAVAVMALAISGLSSADTTTPKTNSVATSPTNPPAPNRIATTTTVTNVKPIIPVEEGRRLILSGKISEAESVLQRAVNSGGVEIPTGYTTESITTVQATTNTNAPIKVPQKVQEARRLIELGNLHEAEKILKEAIHDDPKDRVAFYYLDLIKEQIYEKSSTPPALGELLPMPNPSSRTNVSEARKKIYEKLQNIRIDEFPVAQDTPFKEVLKQLSSEIKRWDTNGGRGINLIISQAADRPAKSVEISVTDPLTGELGLAKGFVVSSKGGAQHAVTVPPNLDIENLTIKFDPPIHDVTLRQLLDAIVTVAKPPAGPPPPAFRLKYSVEDYAIVFSQTSELDPEQLYTRTFRIDPNMLKQGLEGTVFSANAFQGLVRSNANGGGGPGGFFTFGGSTQPAVTTQSGPLSNQLTYSPNARITITQKGPLSNPQFVTTTTNISAVQNDIRAFFRAVGVDFPTNQEGQSGFPGAGAGLPGQPTPPRKAMFYNDRKGVLFVRATLRDLDIIETALHVINTPPAQVSFSMQIGDMSAEQAALLAKKFSAAPGKEAVTTNEYVAFYPRGATVEGTNSAAVLQLAASRRFFEKATDSLVSTSTVSQTTAFLLTKQQKEELVKVMENSKGIDLVATPSVTSKVNQLARLSIGEVRPFVTPETLKKAEALQISIGAEVDVIAKRADALGVTLESTVTVSSFLGYAATEIDAKGERMRLPRFRVRSTELKEEVPFDSCLLVIVDHDETGSTKTSVPVLGDIPLLGRLFRTEKPDNATKLRQSLIIITPVVIDATGMPVNFSK